MNGSFYLSAPPQQTWPLTTDALSRRIAATFPGARVRPGVSPRTKAQLLDIEFRLADGETYSATYREFRHLVLLDGSPDLWAETMIWFLRQLPSGTPVCAMRDGDDPLPVQLPADVRSEPSRISRFFHELKA